MAFLSDSFYKSSYPKVLNLKCKCVQFTKLTYPILDLGRNILFYLSLHTYWNLELTGMVNNTLIELKKLLNSMETDLGLSSLSEVERNILYAIKDLEKENGSAKTGDLLGHEFTSKMSRISVFRGLKALEQQQIIERKTSKRGEYIVSPSN